MEFIKYPKTKRFSSDIVITEKIDGTNAQLVIDDGVLVAGSRNRFLTLDEDNYGFARWLEDNREILTKYFGSFDYPIYGEWWGSGIQRNYGFTHGKKFFSLFRAGLFGPEMPPELLEIGVRYVPVLYEGDNTESIIYSTFNTLRASSRVFSYLDPVYPYPEGICIFFKQTGAIFKMTYEFEKGKWHG